ncbi:MAG: VIT1/CCC1 transporter family protein [Candidatus Komeilibacteria bacterium]|nr:VIT1/CCC1 transporter family protein [Candidatus Komeilibacteria bacterium]
MHDQRFIHHQNSKIITNIREVVFGLEDGLVSTLGAITGIAAGTGSHFTVILAGLVIIAVESISMGVGVFLADASAKDIDDRKIDEEKFEIDNFLDKERAELKGFYQHDGWPEKLAEQMSVAASQNKHLLLKEMLTRELKIFSQPTQSLKKGVVMFLAYIAGGLIPLLPYFFIPLPQATYLSVACTLAGLFILGAGVGKLSLSNWFKHALKMLILGGLALSAGLLMSQLSQKFIS